MALATLFNAHIAQLQSSYERAMLATATPCDAILVHSGSEQYTYADDRGIAFKSWGHFLHWLPVIRPDQMLLFVPGQKPVYFQVIPPDFWYEQSISMESWWADQFEIVNLENAEQVRPYLSNKGRIGFLGENTTFAKAVGLDTELHNPAALLHWLDYQRAYKTEYEVAQLREANRIALLGHAAAQKAFANGESEYDIHMAYLQACNILEEETPYTNIVGVNEKSAILHYQNKRRLPPEKSGMAPLGNQVLLIDAGCRVNNYCSDITRTHTLPYTNPLFISLVAAMESLQHEIIELILVGRPYLDLHIATHEGVLEILAAHDICSGSFDELLKSGISTLFLPHGLGHLLGIQVHDVGGRQRNPQGDILAPPAEYPALRNTRTIEPGQVFTIEPGLYFIPALLNPERNSARGKLINWKLVDELLPLGGIRIEDNVLVTEHGAQNLTR